MLPGSEESQPDTADFERELTEVLPSDLPNRAMVIEKAARHLALIVETNKHFNLTRITTPHEAAIKHVLDCVLPWRLFDGARHIVDAGSGAGFPGIPLALVLSSTKFTLCESTGKRSRFLDSVIDNLVLRNVDIAAGRVEELLRSRKADVITARAFAPMYRALALFAPALKAGCRVLLYKGPDPENEIAEAAEEIRKNRLHVRIASRYELLEDMGQRTIVEVRCEGSYRV